MGSQFSQFFYKNILSTFYNDGLRFLKWRYLRVQVYKYLMRKIN